MTRASLRFLRFSLQFSSYLGIEMLQCSNLRCSKVIMLLKLLKLNVWEVSRA